MSLKLKIKLNKKNLHVIRYKKFFRLFRRRKSKSSALSDGQKRPSVLDGHPSCVQSQPSMWQISFSRLREEWNNYCSVDKLHLTIRI